jgi:vancomycin aglycone glucosyltransferase
LIAEQFDMLPAAAEDCDALVATGLFPVAAGAQSVAEKLEVRYVYAAYCPIFLPSPHHPPQPLPGRPLPPEVTDSRPLPAELETFLDAGTPPVYVGFGSMPAPKDMARVAIDSIRAQGRRALIARGWADLALIDDRDDCFVVGEVNQQALFRGVAAVVHHGGAGTTTTATRAGAPQVVVPQMADQPYWAGRVADLGVGAAHEGPTPTPESLSAALGTALTPQTLARASAVAGTIRIDGATVAATLLLNAVS